MAARAELRSDVLVQNADVKNNVIQKEVFPFGYIKKFVLFAILGLLVSTNAISQCTWTWYQDSDGDGFGRSDVSITTACNATTPAGYTLNKLDCNDNSSNNPIWTTLGGTSFSLGAVTATEIAVGSTANPITLYRNFTFGGTAPMTAKRYNGTSWIALGNDPIADYMYGSDIDIDGNDVPYISYLDFDQFDNNNNRATVIKYDGSSWIQVGNRRFSDEILPTRGVSLAIDNTNKPYVVLVNSTSQLQVMKFDGAAWMVVGPGAFGSSGSPDPSIAINNSGVPYVAFAENSGDKISVMKYNAPAWELVGNASFSDNDMDFPIIAIDKTDNPYVAYYDQGGEVVVQKLNTAMIWEKLGTIYVGGSSSISFNIDRDNVPHIVYNDATLKITHKKWDGTAWVVVGTSEFATGVDISMAIGKNDNIPYVSYRDSNDDKVKVKSLSPAPAPPTVPTVTSPDGTICNGETTTLNISAGNLNDATQWQWYTTSCGGTPFGTGTSINVSPTANTTYYARGEGSCVPSPASCANILVTVNSLPVIATQPLLTFNVCEGLNTSTALSTSGPNLTNQWYEDKNDGNGWTLLLGQTSNTLNLTNVPIVMNGYNYRAIVTNTLTTCQSTSTASSLTVNTLPNITAQPPTSSTVCQGNNLNLAATATGSNLTYQWYENMGSGWAILSGETNNSLLLSGVAAALNSNQYRVSISNSLTNCTSTSSPSLLTVNTPPQVITQPQSTILCAGNNITFNTSSTGTSLTYQWQRNEGSGWNNISGETTSTLSINGASATLNGYEYRIVASNTACTDATSQPAVLTVNTQPTITTHPLSQTICSGGNANFIASASGTNLGYQWQRNTGSGWVDLTGEIASNLSLSGVDGTIEGYQYRVVVSNAGCVAVESRPAQITISTSPALTGPPDESVCEGGNTAFSIEVNSTDITYRWQLNAGMAWENITGGTTSELILQNVRTNMDQYKYRVIVSVPQCEDAISREAILSVKNAPMFTNQPENIKVCEREDARFSVEVLGTDLQYQWQVNEGSGWTDIEGEQEAQLTINNVTAGMSTNRYHVVVSGISCEPVISSEVNFSIDLITCFNELLISEGVSPNGDGNFDYWFIQGIDQYPNNKVKLFNVWGDLIYETTKYDNETKVWNGQSNKAFAGASYAPDGTYYYIIDLGNGRSVLRGFVVLKR